MKTKIKVLASLLLVAVFGCVLTSCGNDSNEESSSLSFTDIVGSFQITNISGNNSHSWLKAGQIMTFNSDGTCTTGFTMEDSWKNENGIIKTYCKSNNEPMFVYELKSRNGSSYEVQMKGTLDDDTSLRLTLQKLDESSKSKYVGVWSDGKHFLSISSDGYLAAYAGTNFIDCGSFTITGSIIKCSNTYYSKETVYTITSVSDNSISVKVDYTDIYGDSKTSNLVLAKTNDTPTVKDHALNGKSASYLTTSLGTITLDFGGYNSGKKTSTLSNCKKYPLSLFYVYINRKVYFQQFTSKTGQVPSIGGWTTSCDDGTIFVYEVKFASNGMVEDISNITKTAI